jgi:hypothetical protein
MKTARRSLSMFAALLAAAGCTGGGAQQGAGADLEQSVDRPGRSHTPARTAAGVTMQYFGGPVIPNPKVYVVWWGNPASLNPAITAARGGIADFYAGVTNSNYFDWLNEYNTTIAAQAGSHAGSAGTNQRMGRGNYAGTLTLTSIPAGNVTDAQIQSTLDQAFAAGTLPQPDENTIYAIYFPSSVSISLGGSTSCGSFGAYHEAIVEATRHNAYYLVMPDCGDSFSGITSVSSHELIEAVTDGQPTPGSNPDYPQAWNDSSGSEVGDLCQSSSGTVTTALGSFNVQGIWDERSQGCLIFRANAQDFNVSLASNTGNVAAGVNTAFTISTATVAGAAEALALTVAAPAGVSATISPASITSGQTATLTVNAPASATPLQLVLRADGAAGTHTAALLLRTTGAVANDFSLTASPASVTAAPGATASFSVATAVVSGSGQPISLSLAGLPAGATGSFSPASLNAGASATLAVAVGASTAAGTYALTITGSGSSATHQASVSLTVSSTSTGGGLSNGGFESQLTGWTSTGAATVVSGGHTGSAAQLGSTTPSTDSSIAQTFTAPAATTQLSFFTKVICPDTITYDWATATLKDNTANTTATVLAKTCSNSGAWVQTTAAVTAGHSYTLTLSNHDDNYAGDATYTLYDDVTLSGSAPPPPPPPPGSGIANGGFESGAASWTFAGTSSIASAGCHGGTRCAQLGSTAATNGDSTASQSFTVPAGKSQLSLWYRITCPDTLTYDWATVSLKNNGAGTTATVLAKTCTNAGAWTNVTASVTAGASYTLTLTSHDDNYSSDPTYTLYDDVVLN